MRSVYDTLYLWARKTTTSFADLRFLPSQRDEEIDIGDGLIYRLKHWPELPGESKTADVLRALSVMSHRPINRHWILSNSKMRARDVDRLLARLVAQDAVEVIDGTKFSVGAPAAAPAGQRA